MGLNDSLNIIKVEVLKESNNEVTYVHIKSNKKKSRCTKCNQFSNKVHDYLKPSKITYLKNSGNITYLITYKRRFECTYCNKFFTEDLGLTNYKGKISLLVKQHILKDCLDRDLQEAYILKEDFLRITLYTDYKNAKNELKKWINKVL